MEKKKIIVLDGPVGIGKSTILKSLEEVCTNNNITSVSFLREPMNDENLLKIIKSNYSENADTSELQFFFMQHFQKGYSDFINSKESTVLISERSPVSVISIFCKWALKKGKMNKSQCENLKKLFKCVKDAVSDMDVDYCILANASCEECLDRVRNRHKDYDGDIGSKNNISFVEETYNCYQEFTEELQSCDDPKKYGITSFVIIESPSLGSVVDLLKSKV